MRAHKNIYCINREERPNKRQWAAAQFEKQGINVFFVNSGCNQQNFIRTKDEKQRGKFASHAQLWQKLVDEVESKSYFIFEDDIALTENFSRHIPTLEQLVEQENKPNLICFGFISPAPNILGEVKEFIVNPASNFITTWGYIINKQAAMLLLNSKPTHLPLDYFLFSKLDKINLMTTNHSLCIPNLSLGSDVNPPEFSMLKMEVFRGINPAYPF